MKDILIDTLLDGIKLLPFLFVAFLIIEFIEHKYGKKSKMIISKSGKFGPLLGSLLGLFPQCGFSVIATNLYISRIVSLGTLISIYLSTSDEMLPIMITTNTSMKTILLVLLLKFVIGFTAGFLIDLILRKKREQEKVNYHVCTEEHCGCKHGIVRGAINHTINIFIFILSMSFILNILFDSIGAKYLEKILLKESIFGSVITSIIGLIPNCGASVMITELYINNTITFGSLVGGLLTGSGVALLVLFTNNKPFKNNLLVLSLVYGIGVISGIVIDMVGLLL